MDFYKNNMKYQQKLTFFFHAKRMNCRTFYLFYYLNQRRHRLTFYYAKIVELDSIQLYMYIVIYFYVNKQHSTVFCLFPIKNL